MTYRLEFAESALKEWRKLGETVRAHAAGRTDAGVHATGQVVHLDIAKETTAETVRDALNFHLKPAPVARTALPGKQRREGQSAADLPKIRTASAL